MTSKVYLALRVPASPQRAFEIFTQEIALWWQPSGLFQIAPGGDGTLSFEPGVGGRLITRLHSSEVLEIGRIEVWEPGRRLVFTWRQQSFDPGQLTYVEVLFQAVGDQTRVSIEHRGWDGIPREHAARHGFPERTTLEHVARWWRASLARMAARASAQP